MVVVRAMSHSVPPRRRARLTLGVRTFCKEGFAFSSLEDQERLVLRLSDPMTGLTHGTFEDFREFSALHGPCGVPWV